MLADFYSLEDTNGIDANDNYRVRITRDCKLVFLCIFMIKNAF